MSIEFKQISTDVIFITETTNKRALRQWKFLIQRIKLNS